MGQAEEDAEWQRAIDRESRGLPPVRVVYKIKPSHDLGPDEIRILIEVLKEAQHTVLRKALYYKLINMYKDTT